MTTPPNRNRSPSLETALQVGALLAVVPLAYSLTLLASWLLPNLE